MSVYLYSGKDLYRMEKNLNDLYKKNDIDRDHIVSFDGSDKKNFRLDAVFMECGSFSLFDEDNHKAVVVRNPYFLTKSAKDTGKSTRADSSTLKKKKDKDAAKKEEELVLLENYLKDQNKNTLLVFYCDAFEADSRKKEYKLLEKYGAKVMEFGQMNERDFNTYMDEQLTKKGYVLTPEARKEMKDRIDIDTRQLQNAIEKMDLYGKKELNEEDIAHIVPMNSTVNAFKMASMFIQGNFTELLKAKEEMLTFNYDYNAMMLMIAGRLRSLYNMKHLYEEGLNEDDIAVRLHANPWAVKYGLQDCRGMKSDVLLSYLSQLADLDQGIKAGTLDPKDGFEMFLLKNGKIN